MKEFSKEIIEIDGVEYTLFLNRKGIVAWEKYCEKENEKLSKLQEKYQNLMSSVDSNEELEDDTNPFEGLEEIDEFEDDRELITKTFKRLYWIMLYTNHQLTITQSSELYDKASEEYGEENLVALANQMIEDANINKVSNQKQELKNLTALRPAKNKN